MGLALYRPRARSNDLLGVMRDYLGLTPVGTHCDADELAVSEMQVREASTWPLTGVELKERRCSGNVSQINVLLIQKFHESIPKRGECQLKRLWPYTRDV